jgi:DNA-binding transcriptional MerR regulator
MDPAMMYVTIQVCIEQLPGATRDGRRLYKLHSLRAPTATLLLDAGVDITKVQELLGHWGHTRDDALRNIQEVTQLVVEELLEDGQPLADQRDRHGQPRRGDERRMIDYSRLSSVNRHDKSPILGAI